MSYEPRLTDFQPPQYTPSESVTGLPARPLVLATDHSAHTLQPDPATAALAHATSDALHTATRARQVLHRNTLQYAARLLREALPNAAAITADTSDGELYEVRDADGRALYRAPFTPAGPLDDSKADDVAGLLRQAFGFGGLDEAGWQTAAEGEPYRSIALPTVDMARRSAAVSSFPTPEGMATIMAEYTPGATPAFQITGPNAKFARETRDRIRAAIVNGGFEWEPGLMQIVAHWTVVRTGSSSDLALACTALAAAGVIDPATLNGVVMIGELGLDGSVRSVRDVVDMVRIAQEAGYLKFIVARDDFELRQGQREHRHHPGRRERPHGCTRVPLRDARARDHHPGTGDPGAGDARGGRRTLRPVQQSPHLGPQRQAPQRRVGRVHLHRHAAARPQQRSPAGHVAANGGLGSRRRSPQPRLFLRPGTRPAPHRPRTCTPQGRGRPHYLPAPLAPRPPAPGPGGNRLTASASRRLAGVTATPPTVCPAAPRHPPTPQRATACPATAHAHRRSPLPGDGARQLRGTRT
ncbi:magnesium chelatase domain-containing protein [Streptomyces scabiei]|uniref:magnesium chelatase domain-containing protein n=1 Tax=Streptomyces scabiei TaxID=1930 RepID=UPI00340D9747